jgi:hypothetical protein
MQPLNWKVSEKPIQLSLEHALGKIILPSETSALRDREGRVSAANCRIETASFKKRILASADRFRGWSTGGRVIR